jgi:ankyrin repeat protein
MDHTNGVSVLMLAAKSGNIQTVKLLLEHGADVEAKDSHWDSAMDCAETEDIKELLRQYGGE